MRTTENLIKIKREIENLSRSAQIGMLRVLYARKTITINENNNGSFVNLTGLNEEDLSIIEDYLSYLQEQSRRIAILENKRKAIELKYFSAVNTDPNLPLHELSLSAPT